MGHQSASDLCQSGSYGLRVGGTATTAERYNIQHNSRTPDWPGLWLSCSVPDECLGSAKRDGNGPRIPGAYVGYDNLCRADDACNPGFKSRTARRPGDHPARLNGSDANSTGWRSHRRRNLVDCGCGRTRAKVSSQVHRHSDSVFLAHDILRLHAAWRSDPEAADISSCLAMTKDSTDIARAIIAVAPKSVFKLSLASCCNGPTLKAAIPYPI